MNQETNHAPLDAAKAAGPAGWLLDAEIKLIPKMTSQVIAQFLEMRSDFSDVLGVAQTMVGGLSDLINLQGMDADMIEKYREHTGQLNNYLTTIAEKHFGAFYQLRAHSILDVAEAGGDVSGNAGDEPGEESADELARDLQADNPEGAS